MLVHWSAFAVAAVLVSLSVDGTLPALVAIASYFTVLLAHELGHAWFARRQRLRVTAIRLSAIHGLCEFEEPDSEEQDYIVAWGGVTAQLAIAVPVIVLNAVFDLANIGPLGPMVVILGYLNLVIAGFNLIPSEPLDGGKAWRLVPLLAEKWRAGRFRPSRKRKKFSLIK